MGEQKGFADFRDLAIRKTVDALIPAFKCPKCGFPLRVAAFIYWRKNGTISPILSSKSLRIAMMPTGMYDKLFEYVESWLGISIEHILFEAQRNISKSLFESFGTVLPFLGYVKRIPLVKRFIVEGFNKVAVVTGMSSSTTLEYRPGEYGLARLTNPYSLQLMAANVVGAFEYLEGYPFDYKVIDEGGDNYLVEVNAAVDKPAISQRLVSDKPVTVPGDLEFERCSFCHAPTRVSSRVKWLNDEGMIIDTQSGSRVIMMDAFLLLTVFRELSRELGDEVYEMLIPAQRDWTMEHVELLGNSPGQSGLKGGEFEEAFMDYLNDLPIFGYGNAVSFKVNGPRVNVIIENPFEEDVIAGTLLGLYQVFSSREGKVNWTSKDKATTAYTIEPA